VCVVDQDVGEGVDEADEGVAKEQARDIGVVVVKQHMPWDGLYGGRTRCWRIRERGTS
jgi:hypothetical protein